MKSEAKGLSRLWFASKYSWRGLVAGFKTEPALRQEIIALLIILPVICWLDVSPAERAILLLSTLLVLIVELLNTAVETAVDRIGHDYHELSGKAKDLSSAAVLIALCGAAASWLIILW
ncbi:diacylglycerol kinase [Arsukibacterium tuosuense]|uniref:Diacylglycerol kinase n=1 Tax=Arsukibacterium tuosuense TaxID=1323745 RepID=A0A285JJD7_9GAMM|nr:diacylglycerol kinase [Arsukibacterium tuosuense]SNY60394.1 diacylglycerol kinase [Arsukibacterium tuosuense]